MRLDHLVMRMTAVKGAEWLQAYVLIDVMPGVDVETFRFEVPKRLSYHHETEKYLGGVPGDLFIGFFAKGQKELFDEVSRIKAMPEVKEVKDWAIANFPVSQPELTRLDWQILKCKRADADMSIGVIAEKLSQDKALVQKRSEYLQTLPLAFSIERPNQKQWSFTEIQINFFGTTFEERLGELRQFGKPFGAVNSKSQGALMVEPASIEELKERINAVSKISGVKVVGFTFCEDMLWTQPWLDRFIDEQIEITG